MPRTIQAFILMVATLVSLALFGGAYLIATHIHDESVKGSALVAADSVAHITYNAMLQGITQGWSRVQLEQFIATTRATMQQTSTTVNIYRAKSVAQQFGASERDKMDDTVHKVMRDGKLKKQEGPYEVRYLFPLKASGECINCHSSADRNDVLGVIDVGLDLRSTIIKGREEFAETFGWIAPLPFLAAFLLTLFLNKKFKASTALLGKSVEAVNKVSDLRDMKLRGPKLGFAELNNIFGKIEQLVSKLRSVAVDKDLLEFKIRLLEKFIITSEVIKDRRHYVGQLLLDINRVINAYAFFSIFKVDDELFGLEIFWRYPPSVSAQNMMEAKIRNVLLQDSNFTGITINASHDVACQDGPVLDLEPKDVEVQTKTLLEGASKIGGIVGVGIQADTVRDETRQLVLEGILSTLVNVAGSAQAISKYTRDLEYYATRDPLTNLYNQRVFWETLANEINRSQRHQQQFCLLIIDLDNFKTINDTYGHSFGDRLLEELAVAVGKALRSADILARYGGDEFVVILPETCQEQGSAVAARILECISVLSLIAPDQSRVQVTVSVGLSVYPDHATDHRDLFLFADNMMYKAKEEGRNRVGVPTGKDVIKWLPRESGELYTHDEDRAMQTGEVVGIAARIGAIHNPDCLVMEKAL